MNKLEPPIVKQDTKIKILRKRVREEVGKVKEVFIWFKIKLKQLKDKNNNI